MRETKPFTDRAHILKAEAAAALDNPQEFARRLKTTHPAAPAEAARLQVRISGPTRAALDTAREAIRRARPQSIGMNKNAADRCDRAGEITGDTIRIYLNY